MDSDTTHTTSDKEATVAHDHFADQAIDPACNYCQLALAYRPLDVAPERCDHRSDLGLGCARSAGHAGAHWLTGQPEAARADLVRQGILGR